MMIDESRFRRILREEARKILNEEALSGVSAASVAAGTAPSSYRAVPVGTAAKAAGAKATTAPATKKPGT